MTHRPASPIHVNHIGFRDDDPLKRAVVPLAPGQIGLIGEQIFQVVQMSEFIRSPFNSPRQLATLNLHRGQIVDTPMGRYSVCDFSDLTARGGYQIQHEGSRSYPFLIYRPLWRRLFRILLEWYRIASCGVPVAGYHETCHLDDCRMAPDGRQLDLVGGWHDAGDLRKWTSTMAMVTMRLADFLAEQGGNLAALDVDPQLVWSQFRRGGEYLLKCIDPKTNLVWHSIAADGDNTCCTWTDNVPNSGDERWADPHTPPYTADMHVRTLSALAVALAGHDDPLAARCKAAALAVWSACKDQVARDGTVDALVPMALRLWQATGDGQFRDLARAGISALLDRQVLAPRFGQDRLRGYFAGSDDIDGNKRHGRRTGRNLYHFMGRAELLAQALTLWPADPDAPRWKDSLTAFLEGCAKPMMHLSPYLSLPASLYVGGKGLAGGRPLEGDLLFHYFPHENEGPNCELANAAAALALSARVLDQPRWAAYGQKQLEWIMGFNPFGTCMMTGLGYSSLAVFSYYVGQIPGAIINGIRGDENDNPLLSLDRQCDASSMEYWSVHTAAVLRALALLENQPLA